MQRQRVAVVGLVFVLATSGCVSFVTGGPISFEADSAIIESQTATELGYEQTRNNATTVSRTVQVFGQEREVRLRTWQAVYTRASIPNETVTNETMANASVGASLVTIISTPDARFFGQSVSPLARLSNEQLIQNFGPSGASSGGLEQVGSTNLTMLGSETELSVFNSTTESQTGATTSTRVYVAKTPHEGDVVVVVGVHPSGVDGARDRIETAVQNLEHPAQANATSG